MPEDPINQLMKNQAKILVHHASDCNVLALVILMRPDVSAQLYDNFKGRSLTATNANGDEVTIPVAQLMQATIVTQFRGEIES